MKSAWRVSHKQTGEQTLVHSLGLDFSVGDTLHVAIRTLSVSAASLVWTTVRCGKSQRVLAQMSPLSHDKCPPLLSRRQGGGAIAWK
jgi:hypothetical protein